MSRDVLPTAYETKLYNVRRADLNSLDRLIIDLAVGHHKIELVRVPGGKLHFDRVHDRESAELEVHPVV